MNMSTAHVNTSIGEPDLRLTRFSISNYKSIERIEAKCPDGLLVFVGRNDVGKSNIIDFFSFIRDARHSFAHALNSRGENLREIVRRKINGVTVEAEFEFSVSEQTRIEAIRDLFTDNPNTTADRIISSSFLRKVGVNVKFSENRLFEELNCSNIQHDFPSCVVFRNTGDKERLAHFYGQLEVHCKTQTDIIPEHLQEAGGQSGGHLTRLQLGNLGVSNSAWRTSLQLAAAVSKYFDRVQWLDPFRITPARMSIQGQSDLAPNASNLPDVLHWLYNNRPSRFQRIESEVRKLVPHLGRLYTPTSQNSTTLGAGDIQGGEDLFYTLGQMSAGTKSAVAIITKVVLAEPGAWLCIEEPESYLHPKAQFALFSFLREEAKAKSIFVTTHSAVIAAGTPLESLLLVKRNEKNATCVQPVTKDNVGSVIDELGIKPSFSFEADAIVFVEGLEDVPVFEVWAEKHGLGRSIQFINAEGGSTLHYFANAKVAMSKHVHTLVCVVFDGDTQREERDKRTKERLVAELKLPPEQIFTLDMNEVEGYLLHPAAIRRAFSAIELSEDELEKRLAPFRARRNQKKALNELFKEYKLGVYEGRLGAKIAEAMDRVPPFIAGVFDKINQLIASRA